MQEFPSLHVEMFVHFRVYVIHVIYLAGELFTYKQLDREEQALYSVPVTATDGGGRTGYTVVRINVADQGDNVPQFVMEDYKANVYSSVEIGTFVVQVIFALM